MIKNWILASRMKTLTAAVVPIIAGVALTFSNGYSIDWLIVLLVVASSLLIQIATNLINDAADFKKGTDDETRLGPVRAAASGVISEQRLMSMAYVLLVGAVVCGIPLVLKGGVPILLIGFFSLIAAWAYTAGPYPLAYHGLGDFFVILFFGVIGVSGMVYLLTGTWILEAVVLGIQIGFLCATLIAINNIRDIEGDRRANKKTLPVRFGISFARLGIAIYFLLPFVLQIFWFSKQKWYAIGLPFLIFPTAIILLRSIFKTEPSRSYNQFLAKASLIHFAFGSLLSLGLIL